jgi:hypothetical protein
MMEHVIRRPNGVDTVVALEDGALHTGTVQDCTPILERAKALHAEGAYGSPDMRLAATVPAVLVERYLNDNAITMQEFTRSPEHQKRLLNDPAIEHFRVWKGRV